MNRLTLTLMLSFTLLGCRWEESDCDKAVSFRHDAEIRVSSRAGSSAGAAGHSGQDSEPEPEPECVDDSDCDIDSFCDTDDGLCVPGTTCEDESSCDPGFNCDEDLLVCLPADQERCSELEDDDACAERDDCESVYAGVDCSCGPECTCMGGEPGCVCESFEFFKCVELDD